MNSLKNETDKYTNILKVRKDTIKTNKILYGDNICITYFMEESSELNKELSKSLRGKGNLQSIKEEISDVYYTLSMLIQDMGISQEDINKIIQHKQLRADKEMKIINLNK